MIMVRFTGFFLLLLFSARVHAQNASLSSGTLMDGEPNLAMNPANPKNLVVAWMNLGLSEGKIKITIKVRSSFDGGKTWGAAINMPHMATTYGSADPTMVFHRSGKLFLGYLDYRKSPDSGGLYVCNSMDGGKTFSTPLKAWDALEVSKRAIDRPWLAIDNSGTSTDGTLFVTTKPAPWIPAPNRPYLKVSTDGAMSWGNWKYLDSTGFLVGNAIQAPMAAPNVTKSGLFVAAFPSYVVSQNVYPRFILATSRTAGAKLNYIPMQAANDAVSDTNLKLGYFLAADPNNTNRMALIRVAKSGSGDADIMVMRTNDEGETWTAQVRVNDDTLGNGKLQDMPWACYGNNGTLAAVWRDRRNSPGTGFFNQATDCYCAFSKDNGATWSKNIKISTQTAGYDAILTQNGNDFQGCTLHNDTLYSTWSDTRNGKLVVYFAITDLESGTTTIKTLFSNPTHMRLKIRNTSEWKQISWPQDCVASEFLILDETGKQVFRKTVSDKPDSISLPDDLLPKGNYFLVVKAIHGVITQKVFW
ncbi:MAG: hypothetical protein JNL57_13965 [Bacteroidetes bacterium]|nr:hypothetical protein [Bacteroidota bacterium]